MLRNLATLPKAELHLHLQGAIRPATLNEWATESGVSTPDPQSFATFTEFQLAFQSAFILTRETPQRLERAVTEIVDDAVAAGCVWVQPHFDPHPYEIWGDPDEVMELVLDAGQRAARAAGAGFGITISVARHRSPEAAEDLARFAARYAGRGVCALGMGGDEVRFPAEPFARAFEIARGSGLTCAPHAGELDGAQSVRDAIEHLGATRIAHGVRAIEDQVTIDVLIDRQVTLDVCPTSNVRLGVATSFDQHPLPQLVAAGVGCSLGTDDPMMFGNSLVDEYSRARSMGLDDSQLAEIARTSIASSDAPQAIKQAAISRIQTWMSPGEPRVTMIDRQLRRLSSSGH